MSSDEAVSAEKYNELMSAMSKTKSQWDKEKDDTDDDHDRLLSQAIDLALEQGRGWGPGEKEAYLKTILDDDFIPPIFASTVEEVEKSGLQEAFTSLIYDGEPPVRLMLQFRKKGNEAFQNGQRNVAQNLQYYRDAVNYYYESLAWAEKIEPMNAGDLAQADTDDPTYSATELAKEKAIVCANIALMHIQLKNWGHARNECQKALGFDATNVKVWYRLAKAYEMLKDWESAGDALESGLAVDTNNVDLKRLQRQLQDKINKARRLRQQRERSRAERAARVKQCWKHCRDNHIQLGRVPLVASVNDEDDDDTDAEHIESRWHAHLPHSGQLAECKTVNGEQEWFWPVMFLYPSHHQSDFIKYFGESEMMGLKLAELFPELEEGETKTAMPWDFNNEFTCSQLAIYFEVYLPQDLDTNDTDPIVHPESVELLMDQSSCMRFYEASRALKGDEGPELANVVRAAERKHLYQQQNAWKKKHKSLWAKPDPCPIVRVHPAVTLRDVLIDHRMVVPNFLVTFFLFPENNPAHQIFLNERKCLAIIQPKEVL